MITAIKLNNCDKLQAPPKQMRKINPTRRSVSGQYAFRGELAIPFESTLERDFIIRCEFQHSVLDIIAQPAEIKFRTANKREYTYTPDFLVYYKLGSRSYENYPKPMLVEVKPQEQWKKHWRKWLPKWKAARRYAIQRGWEFRIYDESRIRDQVLKNIKYLERYLRIHSEPQDIELLINTVSSMGSCTVDYLLTRHFPGIYRERGLVFIWSLVAKRLLNCDISARLSLSTELWEINHYE